MPLLLQEGATLTAGDEAKDNFKHHSLESVQLPDMEEMNEAFLAGGTIGEVEHGGLGLKALQPSFKIKGWDPQLMSMYAQRTRSTWTVRGTVRDKQKQILLGVRAVFEARLGKISSDAFEKGKLLGHDHTLIEVVVYRLYFDEKEKYYWDHFGDDFRIDGIDMLRDERRLLGLPG